MPHGRKLEGEELYELRVRQSTDCPAVLLPFWHGDVYRDLRLRQEESENKPARDSASCLTSKPLCFGIWGMKSVPYETCREKQLQKPELKREYDALKREFALAREIIELRKRQNLIQKQLADRIGTSQPAIARLEFGSYQSLSLSFLRRVAEALGATPEIHLKEKEA